MKRIIDWKKIRLDYESGSSQAELRKKYNLPHSTLAMKIKREEWKLSQEQQANLSKLKESLRQVSQDISQANTTQANSILEKITTIIEDNELMLTNRKIMRAFQQNIVKGIKNGEYETAKDIKAGTSAIKDIESIANPYPETIIQNNNQNQQQNNITVEWE